jgi:pimeloyl-ACP methyl ester carboxylesterase
MGRPDSRPSLRDIRCATVLVWGRQDGMATHDHQQEMLAGIANARLAILEDTGHFTTLERPGDVARILRELIDGIRAAH